MAKFHLFFLVLSVSILTPFLARAEDDGCATKLSALGIKDQASRNYFCDGREINYRCVEQAVLAGESSGHEALVKCATQNSDQDIMTTQTDMLAAGNGSHLRSDVKVWNKGELILALSLATAMHSQKKCTAGPFMDKQNHKVLGHGLGNALGVALIGWMTDNCVLGVDTMIIASAIREQMKINTHNNCEGHSMLWDGIGIVAGGQTCSWLERNVMKPKFLRELSERIFGHHSTMTVLPDKSIGVVKEF